MSGSFLKRKFKIVGGNETKLFINYLLIGGFSSMVDIGLLYFLTEFFGFWYFYSSIISYLCGVIPNYTLNKFFNFKNKSKKIIPQFTAFLFVSIIGLLLTQILIFSLVEFFNLWYIISKIITIMIVIFWNFYGIKRIAFGIFK